MAILSRHQKDSLRREHGSSPKAELLGVEDKWGGGQDIPEIRTAHSWRDQGGGGLS